MENEIRETIANLIEAGSTFNIENLDHLYHDDLKIVRIDQTGEAKILKKTDVISFFEFKKKNKHPHLNKSYQINYVDVGADLAQVVLTRIIDLTGKLEKAVYNICLIKKKMNWTVLKETVVVQ